MLFPVIQLESSVVSMRLRQLLSTPFWLSHSLPLPFSLPHLASCTPPGQLFHGGAQVTRGSRYVTTRPLPPHLKHCLIAQITYQDFRPDTSFRCSFFWISIALDINAATSFRYVCVCVHMCVHAIVRELVLECWRACRCARIRGPEIHSGCVMDAEFDYTFLSMMGRP